MSSQDPNTSPHKAYDVFICYSPMDKLVADTVCAQLEAKGIRCWIAPRDLLQNVSYADASIKAIENCHIMVVILSFSSNDSPIIIRDVNKAVTQKLRIISYRIGDVIPSKSLIYLLAGTQEINAIDNRMLPSLIRLVQDDLSELNSGRQEKKKIILYPAKMGERFGALLIDGIIGFMIPFFLLEIVKFYIPSTSLMINNMWEGISLGNLLLFLFLSYFCYSTIMEASRWKGTFGKKFCDLIVTTTSNTKASILQIMLRNLVKWAFFIFILPFLLTVILAFVNPNKQAFHDLISDTVVQKNPASWRRYKITKTIQNDVIR